MPKSEPEKPVFYNVDGDKNVFENLSRELAEAQHEIVVDVWREEAELLRNDLQQAEARGVRLLWSCDGGEGMLDQPVPWPGLPMYGTGNGRKFSLVVDRRWCMLGMRGESCATQALVTEHPVMTGLFAESFCSRAGVVRIGTGYGEELESRYGHRYEELSARYWSSPSGEVDQS